MSTTDWRRAYEADLHPGRLPRLSARVIERAAERQDRSERRVAEVLELEEFRRRRQIREASRPAER